jgi:hypothetical protein
LLNKESVGGHVLISVDRIRHYVPRIRKGHLSAREAAEDIAFPFVCGIVNQAGAESTFIELVKGGEHAKQA